MPRKPQLTVTVSRYPPFAKKRYYAVAIASLRQTRRPAQLIFEFTCLDPDQDGRTVTWQRPLPIRPNDSTAKLLRAVGLSPMADTQIDLSDLVGCRVQVRLATAENGEAAPIAFKPAAAPKPAGAASADHASPSPATEEDFAPDAVEWWRANLNQPLDPHLKYPRSRADAPTAKTRRRRGRRGRRRWFPAQAVRRPGRRRGR